MKISCIDKELREVLSGGFYKIPRFQRPYLWEKEQVEDFWEDAIANAETDYFIGSMVVFRMGSDSFGVVDGQQRLTTITMLLCAIRNAFADEGREELAQGIQNLIEKRDISNHLQYILQTETSYPYLQEHIQKFGEPDADDITAGDEESRLESAFGILTSLVTSTVDAIASDASLSENKREAAIIKKLSDIRDRLLRIKLIVVELDNEEDAYLIFETLNTRGKDLTVSDLVKNHLARLIRPKNKNVDLARDRWDKMVEILEGSEADLRVNSYLHHLWLSERDYTTEKKLFKEIRGIVKKGNADDYLKTLVKEATTYREIQETSYRKWKKHELSLKGSLDAMNVFRVKQQLPMTMAVLRSFKEGALKLSAAQAVLQAIENFHFVFTAVTSQRSSGGISFMYALHARQLLASTDANSQAKCIRDLVNKLRDRVPTFAEFDEGFGRIHYSNAFTKQKKLVQYILAKVDAHHADGLPVDYDRMTIEHLASQNPSKGTVTAKQVGRIGNLILVDGPLNRELANKEFVQKQMILRGSRVWVDPVLDKAGTWTDLEIEARTKHLAKLAFEVIWKV